MAAPKARDLSQAERDFMRDVFTKGLAEARRIHGITEAQVIDIFAASGLSDAQADVLSQLPDLAGQAGFDPEKLPQPIKDLRASLLTQQEQASDIIAGRDAVSQGLSPIFQGQTNEQLARANIGFEIERQRGRTGESQDIFGRAREVFETGGRARADGLLELEKNALMALGTPDADLARIRNAGEALAKAGGFTPELKALMGQATQLLNTTGGMTPELRQVFDSAISLVRSGGEGGALLPRDQVINFARDEASKAINENAEAAIRESLSRGGGPGALLAGAQGGRLAEFSDKASQLQADTLRKALTDRQALQLDQLKTAFGAAGGAAEAGAARETQLRSSGASLAASLANAASSNLQAGLGTALGAQNAEIARQAGLRGNIADIGQIFAGREATAFGAAQNALNLDTERLRLGTDILGGLTDERLRTGQTLADIRQGGFQGFNTAAGLNLGSLAFGAEQQQREFQNMLNLFGLQAGIGQQGTENIFTGAGLLNQQAQTEAGIADTGIRGANQAALAGAGFQAQPGSFTGSFLSGLGGSLGSGAGNALFAGFGG